MHSTPYTNTKGVGGTYARTHEGVHTEKNQKKGAGLRPLCFAVEGLAPLASIAHPPPMGATVPSMSVKGL